ncbi:sodium-dependent bicarbonate transport family permease [Cognatilysobacter bugurensis]|uniref:Sodium-dependent bicarbonate transport family permease n=1 Tax=Cognatilysobacter bugurensis TaxID=543356 RepID=A0A918SW41_9GAMM|nr:sodium-dependent bicarbonate transport family permease [Lysobacter bugurensis]GHA71779.1 sodium-dependent bicarbonate transport family permease [Lysobacter bugurensis]
MELLVANLTAPVVLAFALGLFARAIRSDLEIPPQIQAYLSIFLLLAIGLKGGVALRGQEPLSLIIMLAVTLAAGAVTALSAYLLARWVLGDIRREAAAIAAHYGSVSAVTFIAANQFVERSGAPAEGVLVALLVALEVPALLIGLALGQKDQPVGGSSHHTLREVFTGKTAVLLLGGLAIGAITGPGGIKAVDAMYFALFQGVLMLFMLDMGMIAAGRLAALRQGWGRLLLFCIGVPLLHGTAGVAIGLAMGLSVGGATVFGTMLSSASYIAAPAAVRAGLPEADVGRCVTAALGITFPFNLAIGIPLYAGLAQLLSR